MLTLTLEPSFLMAIALAATLAGLVRGFAGFGDALIFLPIAGLFLPPVLAVTIFVMIAAPGPLPMMGAAWREVDRPIVMRVVLFMILFLPLGFWLLTRADPAMFKFVLSLIAIALVVSMVLGLRFHLVIDRMRASILGIFSGILGGFTGVPGALLAYIYMNSQFSAAQMRAQITIVLFAFDIVILMMSFFGGYIQWSHALAALMILPLYMLANAVGKRLFNPEHELIYRRLALLTIFMSGLIGLPWGFFSQTH